MPAFGRSRWRRPRRAAVLAAYPPKPPQRGTLAKNPSTLPGTRQQRLLRSSVGCRWPASPCWYEALTSRRWRLHAEAGQGELDRTSQVREPPPVAGRARRASPHRRRTLDSGARGPAAVEGRRGKKLTEIGEVPIGRTSFFRPSTGDGPRASSSTGQRRSAGPRLGAGSQARRAKREADPPRTYKNPSPLPCAGKRRRAASARRGRGCGGLGDAGDPACPGGRRRGRPRSGRPQAPLEVVEKFLTSIAVLLAKSS
jgi:hypothetical protein